MSDVENLFFLLDLPSGEGYPQVSISWGVEKEGVSSCMPRTNTADVPTVVGPKKEIWGTKLIGKGKGIKNLHFSSLFPSLEMLWMSGLF